MQFYIMREMRGLTLVGIRWLYISKIGQVFKIPNPKNLVFKPVPELAGESVLEVSFCYEIKNRKPWMLTKLFFDRITLNSDGQFVMNDQDRQRAFRNFSIFGFATAEDISKRKGPLPIPNAPIIPNQLEKQALINYLKSVYPILWENSPNILEQEIQQRLKMHQDQIDTIKIASLLRNKN